MTHAKMGKILGVLLAGLMLLTLLGAAPAAGRESAPVPPQTGPTPDQEEAGQTVQVKSVDELVAAIGPNVTVELLSGEYDLAAAATYGKDTNNRYCRWEASSETGYELVIFGVDGLTLRGAGMDKTTLLAEDRYANVLSFSSCRNVTVADLTAGHSPQPGYCSGGVLHFAHCDQIAATGCGLFGCGSMGVWASDCSGLTVTDSRIYECSVNAVSVDGCRNVRVLDSEIDHNGWQRDDPAYCLFETSGGDGFTLDRCRIHDNTANLLLACGNTRNVRFVSCRVAYNVLQGAFALYDQPAVVDGCAFHRNDIGAWYAESYELASLAARDAAGKTLSEDDLAAMEIRPVELPEQELPELAAPTEVAPGGEIAVKTVDEFLAAIGPDRTIVLEESVCLADALTYGTADGQYYRWEATYDGPQLTIIGASGLTIRAAEGREDVTLTAAPRYADVLGFRGCDGVRVSGLTLGHTEGFSECSGAVLDFDSCTGVLVDGCRLYGCGTMGVNAYACTDVALADSEIYDCSIGGVVLYSVYSVSFRNCRIHDVPSPAVALYDCYEVTWNETPVTGNHYDVSPEGALTPVAVG